MNTIRVTFIIKNNTMLNPTYFKRTILMYCTCCHVLSFIHYHIYSVTHTHKHICTSILVRNLIDNALPKLNLNLILTLTLKPSLNPQTASHVLTLRSEVKLVLTNIHSWVICLETGFQLCSSYKNVKWWKIQWLLERNTLHIVHTCSI